MPAAQTLLPQWLAIDKSNPVRFHMKLGLTYMVVGLLVNHFKEVKDPQRVHEDAAHFASLEIDRMQSKRNPSHPANLGNVYLLVVDELVVPFL